MVPVPFADKNGGSWNYEYEYTSATLKSVTDPYNNKKSYTHDKDGNILSKTEPGSGTTWYTYDSAGNILTEKDPMGNVTTYTYNAFGQVVTVAGPQGNSSFTYDGKGNLVSFTDAAGATTTYENDAYGNPVKITNAKNQVTTLTYGSTGSLVSVTDPAGITTTFTYDANGNKLTSTGPAGTITYRYDAMNRLAGVTDPLGHVTSFDYDKLGNRISETDANGNSTTYKYNDQGQVTEMKDALGNPTGFAYGANGGGSCASCSGVDKLTALTDAKNQTTRYSYDKLRRLLKKTYPDSTTESYTYDAAGRITGATNRDMSYTFTYDTAGRMTNTLDSRGFTVEYEYDILGGRTKMTLQKGGAEQHVTTYGYDSANRPATITSGSGTFTYAYDNAGRRSSTAYPNGNTATYRYDSLGRLTSLRHATATATVAFANYSGFDKIGNRTSKATSGGSETYSYDNIYRLTRSVTPKGTENYSYDPVGNRLSGPGPKDTRYRYNDGNQMTAGRLFSYAYDDNGNRTARMTPAGYNKSWTETWDFENRLIKSEQLKGPEKRTITFKYDPLGRRIQKQLTTVISGVTSTSTWVYVYDKDNIALEIYTDPAGAVEKTWYTHGVEVDEHLALERNGSSFYYHADGLGSVTAMTNGSGSVVESYIYDSFGKMQPSSNFRNSYAYTGREWDKETRLYYYRARRKLPRKRDMK